MNPLSIQQIGPAIPGNPPPVPREPDWLWPAVIILLLLSWWLYFRAPGQRFLSPWTIIDL